MFKDEQYIVKKADALETLERTIGFINNCDTKASVLLGVYGVILTIMLSKDAALEMKSLFDFSVSRGDWVKFLIPFCLVFGTCLLLIGLYKLLSVFSPKINCNDLKQNGLELNSNIFFGTICASRSYEGFKECFLNCSDEEFLNDIMSQIYLNSKICIKKFSNCKIGLFASTIGAVVLGSTWVLGLFLFS